MRPLFGVMENARVENLLAGRAAITRGGGISGCGRELHQRIRGAGGVRGGQRDRAVRGGGQRCAESPAPTRIEVEPEAQDKAGAAGSAEAGSSSAAADSAPGETGRKRERPGG